jgi:hypothetical protein
MLYEFEGLKLVSDAEMTYCVFFYAVLVAYLVGAAICVSWILVYVLYFQKIKGRL